MSDSGSDLALALELADMADEVTAARFRAADLQIDTKADHSPVTDADRRVEELVRERVAAARPGHAVLGEEQGHSGDSPWCWVIDPIDGTKNFARGVPVWATLLSLQHEGEEVCAVVSAPALGHRWWAVRGEGAQRDGQPIAVSRTQRLEEATVSFTDVRDFAAYGWADGFERLGQRCRVMRGFGDFWSHMLVAEGAIDCGVEPVINGWDISAARLIVTEAGGRLTDFAGVGTIRGGNVVTSNARIHDAVISCLRGGAHDITPSPVRHP